MKSFSCYTLEMKWGHKKPLKQTSIPLDPTLSFKWQLNIEIELQGSMQKWGKESYHSSTSQGLSEPLRPTTEESDLEKEQTSTVLSSP